MEKNLTLETRAELDSLKEFLISISAPGNQSNDDISYTLDDAKQWYEQVLSSIPSIDEVDVSDEINAEYSVFSLRQEHIIEYTISNCM